MDLTPAILEDRFVRLEPMEERHREAFRAACDADLQTWIDLYPYAMGGAHFDEGWARFYADPPKDRINFAVMADGRCVGVSSYLGVDGPNATVEIGGTYYAPEARAGR